MKNFVWTRIFFSPLSQEQGSQGHQDSPSPEYQHLPGDGARLRPGWDMGLLVVLAWWETGQGCGELETGHVAASQRQGLMARGRADMGSWAMGKVGECVRGNWAGTLRSWQFSQPASQIALFLETVCYHWYLCLLSSMSLSCCFGVFFPFKTTGMLVPWIAWVWLTAVLTAAFCPCFHLNLSCSFQTIAPTAQDLSESSLCSLKTLNLFHLNCSKMKVWCFVPCH